MLGSVAEVFGAALDDLLDLTQDHRLTRVLPHQLPEALFGEVSPDAGMTRMIPQHG